MKQFLYDVLSKRNCDLSTDQGETASTEPPFAAGHLQDAIDLGNLTKGGGTTNVSFCLMLGEERQSSQVS
jgi:hypothetical protein